MGGGAGDIWQLLPIPPLRVESGGSSAQWSPVRPQQPGSGPPVPRQHNMGSSNWLAAQPLDNARPGIAECLWDCAGGQPSKLAEVLQQQSGDQAVPAQKAAVRLGRPEIARQGSHNLPYLPTCLPTSSCWLWRFTQDWSTLMCLDVAASAACCRSMLGCFAIAVSPGLACCC